jgi:hypothetical protein
LLPTFAPKAGHIWQAQLQVREPKFGNLIQVNACLDRFAKPPGKMSTYHINIVNEHFAQDGELEAQDAVTAWQKAIRSAIEIAADQVSHGNPFFGAEVTLQEGNKLIGRYVVSVGATPLKD